MLTISSAQTSCEDLELLASIQEEVGLTRALNGLGPVAPEKPEVQEV